MTPETTPAHTPTPWAAGIYGRISGNIRHLGMHGSVCEFVATCNDPDVKGRTWENRETWAPQAEANSAFIVRACNSHDALVAALKACLDEAEADPSSVTKRIQKIVYAALPTPSVTL